MKNELWTAQSGFVVILSSVCWLLPLTTPQRQDFPLYCCTLDQPYVRTWDQTVPNALNWILCSALPLAAYAAAGRCSPERHDAAAFVRGLVMSASVAEGLCAGLLKRYVGRARPHFFPRCGWDGAVCTAPLESGAFQSFPSGHATLAFSTLGFCSLYLLGLCRPAVPRPVQIPRTGLHIDLRDLLVLLATAPGSFAAFVAASRTVDHAHHVSDVLAGAALGSFWAAVFYGRYFSAAGQARGQAEPPGAGLSGGILERPLLRDQAPARQPASSPDAKM